MTINSTIKNQPLQCTTQVRTQEFVSKQRMFILMLFNISNQVAFKFNQLNVIVVNMYQLVVVIVDQMVVVTLDQMVVITLDQTVVITLDQLVILQILAIMEPKRFQLT